MTRTLIVALGLLFSPVLVAAQVEVGLDTGLEIEMIDGSDNTTAFHLPTTWARIAFAAGETLLIEPLVGFEYFSQGDVSENRIILIPGVDLLLGERLYIRGEVGLIRYSEDNAGTDFSWSQYGFGGGAGMRIPLGDAALLRLEAALDYWLENADDGVPQRTAIRAQAGVSAVIN